MNTVDKVLLLGDYFNGLADLSRKLTDKYEVQQIAFLNTTHYPNLQIEDDWIIIDFRDFHELTIRLMEFEPDRVIYLSSFNRKSRCEQNPEFADIANSELLEHLREILNIFAGHLILLIPDTNSEEYHHSVLEKTINQGLNIIKGMRRLTIVRYPQILDSSPEGYQAWLGSIDKYKPTKNNVAVVTIPALTAQITEIINKTIFGVHMTNNILLDQAIIVKNILYTGNPMDFT